MSVDQGRSQVGKRFWSALPLTIKSQIKFKRSALLLVVLHRYDASKQELISEEINVAYPIIDGIARLVPTAGRVMEAAESPAST